MVAPTTEDPVLRSARREAVVAALVWAIALTYTVGGSILYGYRDGAEPVRYVYGVPDWAVWFIVLPWGASLVVSWWFAYCWMTDEPLGEEHDQEVPSDGR